MTSQQLCFCLSKNTDAFTQAAEFSGTTCYPVLGYDVSVSGQNGTNTMSTDNSSTSATVNVSSSDMYIVSVVAFTECGNSTSTKGEVNLLVHFISNVLVIKCAM